MHLNAIEFIELGESGDTQSGTLGMSPGHHREKPSGFTAMQNIRRKISLSHLFLNKAKSSVVNKDFI
mgnify:FL=1